MDIVVSAFQWVLYSSAMASILAVIILLIKGLLKNGLGVRWSYCVWFLVLVRLLLPYAPQSSFSIFNLFTLLTEGSHSMVYSMATGQPATTPISGTEYDGIEPDSFGEQVRTEAPFPYLKLAAVVWLAGIAILGLHTLVVTLGFRKKLGKQKICTDESIVSILERCKEQMGVEEEITVLYTRLVRTPAVFGIINPRLLIPVGFDRQVTPEQLQYIIYHELAHLKRKDIAVNCLTRTLQIIHWFNPLLWYSFRCMRAEGELACDALAMSYIEPSECKKYGQTIIQLLENLSTGNRIWGMAGIMENKSQMKRRVMMISRFKKGGYRWTAVSIAVLLLLGCILLTNAQDLKFTGNKDGLQANSISAGENGADGGAIPAAESPEPENATKGRVKDGLVLLDPGHGGKDPGAIYPSGDPESKDVKVREKDLNLQITRQVYDMLKKSGVRVELTRKEDRALGLAERVEMANRLGASLLVSIHTNAEGDASKNGTLTVFNPSGDYSSYGITGEQAARVIQAEVVKGLQTADGGIHKGDNLLLLKNTKMPSILVETAYITNEADREKLMTEAFRARAAQALHDGIIKVLKEMP